MVRIGAYEAIKDKLTNGAHSRGLSASNTPLTDHPNSGKKPSTSQLVIAGALAGGLGGVAGNPADIVLVRMTTDSLKPPEKQLGYRNAIDGVVRVAREEGPAALMRGVLPNTVSLVHA